MANQSTNSTPDTGPKVTSNDVEQLREYVNDFVAGRFYQSVSRGIHTETDTDIIYPLVGRLAAYAQHHKLPQSTNFDTGWQAISELVEHPEFMRTMFQSRRPITEHLINVAGEKIKQDNQQRLMDMKISDMTGSDFRDYLKLLNLNIFR